MSLRPFRTLPKDNVEWARWCTEQEAVPSTAPSGFYKVTNIYYDADNQELVVIHESEAS